jgi:hypothetical protein
MKNLDSYSPSTIPFVVGVVIKGVKLRERKPEPDEAKLKPRHLTEFKIIFVLEALRHINKARWPSGLRRQLKVVSTSNSLVRKGVGSNPTLVNIVLLICYTSLLIRKHGGTRPKIISLEVWT